MKQRGILALCEWEIYRMRRSSKERHKSRKIKDKRKNIIAKDSNNRDSYLKIKI